MERLKISSGTKWESYVGYSRAVKVGSHVYISGTTAVNDKGEVVGKGDVCVQTKFIITNIENALNEVGAKLSDVIRTRMYVTNISEWELIGKAHGEFFKNIKPASTMVEVSRLVDKEHLIEIEADAIID